jgi:dephospho-CoA kinase
MKSLKNIILTGHISSGKTTTAQYLHDKYGYNHYALGNGVKYFIHDLFDVLNSLDPSIQPISLNELYYNKTKYRPYLQRLSTELIKKDFGEDIWIKYLDNIIDTSKPYVIDDIRFKNEYEHYKNNAIFIRIKRDNEIYSSHCSEHDIDDITTDYTIINNGDLNDLYKNIDDIIQNS